MSFAFLAGEGGGGGGTRGYFNAYEACTTLNSNTARSAISTTKRIADVSSVTFMINHGARTCSTKVVIWRACRSPLPHHIERSPRLGDRRVEGGPVVKRNDAQELDEGIDLLDVVLPVDGLSHHSLDTLSQRTSVCP